MKHLIAIAVILVIAMFVWLCPPDPIGAEVEPGAQDTGYVVKQ